ncbi:MAG: DUF2905 domain-containing protein [Isosphaeraceae bacterium]
MTRAGAARLESGLGKLLIAAGLGLVALGLVVLFGSRLGLGRLPGDIVVRGERSTFYFPVVTCLVLSALGSLVLWLIQAIRR